MIYYPPNIIRPNKLLFLAGAIQGAEDWQQKAIQYLNKYKLDIANPRRKYIDKKFDYDTQVFWETYYLNMSDIILFWLPKEIEHIKGRYFAQTSRFELGEWLGKSSYMLNKNIIVGIDEDFIGKRYIINRIKRDYKNIPIFSSLKDSCDYIINNFNLEVKE